MSVLDGQPHPQCIARGTLREELVFTGWKPLRLLRCDACCCSYASGEPRRAPGGSADYVYAKDESGRVVEIWFALDLRGFGRSESAAQLT